MAVIYTEPQYHGKRPGGHGYEHYTREVYCTCGKKIGTQTKYDGWDNFSFDHREQADYKFCPYCGKEFNGGNKSLPFGIQRSAEEVGSVLKELYNNLSRCHKCVYETQCSKDKDYDRNCPLYKRDPKDGGCYG